MNTPCCQSRASVTSGTVVLRRPPNRIAEIGTPCGSSHSGARMGHCDIGVQYREFGCAALVSVSRRIQSWPFQSIRCSGSPSRPSHHTSLSSVRATLVKTVLPASMVFMAFGFELQLVPGATPKKPNSGLTAYRRPSLPKRIQAMSSPNVSARQPGMVGWIMARLVLPQADGNAAAT
ncbi:Uncharacterised protein [Mycobacteroides abscessus subsp. abscessus]|nr:Uncharacterised protein [Mycobacteroides abscessus subsp. abscessus]